MKKLFSFLFLTSGLLVFWVASESQASLINFDFSGGHGKDYMKVFVQDDVELSITASSRDAGIRTRAKVAHKKKGLGVKIGPGDSPVFDSSGANEKLIFTLTGLPSGWDALVLESILFSSYEGGDDFKFKIKRGGAVLRNFDPGSDQWNVGETLSEDERSISWRFIIKLNDIPNSVEDLRISGITFSDSGEGVVLDSHETSSPIPNPEPGTAMLIGSGLLGIAGIGYRRLRKSQRTLPKR